MEKWQEDMLSVSYTAAGVSEIFDRVIAEAKQLGFDTCAYALRIPLSLSKTEATIVTTYPHAWLSRYSEAGYLHTDPTIQHGLNSQAPIVWADNVFSSASNLWDEAQSFGLRVGWAKSCITGNGVAGMLSLARSHEALSSAELASKESRLCWLSTVTHLSFSQLIIPQLRERISLTRRETEVLKWTADGKTSADIADILSVSVNTVNFHIKNAVLKLEVPNKTAAVVRAAMLGMLN